MFVFETMWNTHHHLSLSLSDSYAALHCSSVCVGVCVLCGADIGAVNNCRRTNARCTRAGSSMNGSVRVCGLQYLVGEQCPADIHAEDGSGSNTSLHLARDWCHCKSGTNSDLIVPKLVSFYDGAWEYKNLESAKKTILLDPLYQIH
jgi:hypothetical protein